ncbi:MAG: GNAT family N-acetyltransferase [Phycisphaerales bacterium JB054]
MSDYDIAVADGPATHAQHLAVVTRECFPWSPRWTAWSAYGQRYWRYALSAQSATTIVARMDDGDIGGFALLILDEAMFGREILPACRTLRDSLGIAAYVPLARWSEHRLRRAGIHWDKTQVQQADRPRPRAWIELIGVRPACRGHRLGQRMLEKADNVSRRHGAKSIEALTAIWNSSALAMFERAGFRPVDFTRSTVLSSKAL